MGCPALPLSQHQEELLASLRHPCLAQGSGTKLPFTLEHPENIMGQQLLLQARAWWMGGEEPVIVNQAFCCWDFTAVQEFVCTRGALCLAEPLGGCWEPWPRNAWGRNKPESDQNLLLN